MAAHISMRQTQFSYFNQVLGQPAWKGSKILDFGGNVGGFLTGSDDYVEHNDYWCLDVTQAAIEHGRSDFPRAHFVFYDRYSSYFNSKGIRKLPIPDLGLQFNIILAFSVFTHTHQNEMLDLLEQLGRQLLPGGVLAFTFADPSYDRSVCNPSLRRGTGVIRQFSSHETRSPATGSAESQPRWCVEVDDVLYIEPGAELCQQELLAKPAESYCSYFTADYMNSLFPEATVHLPVSPDWQHCCVLRKDDLLSRGDGKDKLRTRS
ncbi:MAG TPA: class I SAM-dependent methyltransferase [Pyrinomonadaceae bacterium]|nr:class I SAM-dependent methyltransferase [Pyrinomonadaceae bacterium]